MSDCISREAAYHGAGRTRVIATIPSLEGFPTSVSTWRGIIKGYNSQRDVVTLAVDGSNTQDVEVGRTYVQTA